MRKWFKPAFPPRGRFATRIDDSLFVDCMFAFVVPILASGPFGLMLAWYDYGVQATCWNLASAMM